jgi:2-keto-4-pentenoate hydratase
MTSRVFDSPARIRAADMPMLGVEAEIAFRFDRPMPARAREYAYDEVAESATALVAIEIVDSRFRSYKDAPLLDRVADCVSNGGFIRGPARSDWRSIDLSKLTAALLIDGKTVVRQVGGHVAGDPLLPAVALVNDLRHERGLPAGIIVTTGTFTGLNFAKPGQAVVAEFEGFGSANVTFAA